MANRESTAGAIRFHVPIPFFWPYELDLWFYQAEACFTLNNITLDEEKFCYVLSQSPICKPSIGHIRKPPREDKYETLKTQLIRNLNNSKSNRIHQLTKRRELGGRTPSELLHDMQDGMQTAEYRRSSCAFFARIIYSWRQELSLAKWTCRQKNLQYIFDTW